MKWIIYLLLLVNIGFFVWHYKSGESTAVSSFATGKHEEAVLSLVMLKEYQQEKQNRTTRWCYTLGPFDDKKQASAASAILHTAGIQVQRRLSKEARRKAYWVLLPPAESREEARKSISELKQLNIKDYFLVQTGEMVNAVSLGVFTKFESAHRRIKEMQELGFQPDFEKVDLPKREYWLDWPQDTGKSLTEEELARVHEVVANANQLERGCE